MDSSHLLTKKHIQFFKHSLRYFPSEYKNLETSRLTLLFFALSGLDILGALDSLSVEEKKSITDWIYSLQITPDSDPNTRTPYLDLSLPNWLQSDCGSCGHLYFNPTDEQNENIFSCSRRLSLLLPSLSLKQTQLPVPLFISQLHDASPKMDPSEAAETIIFEKSKLYEVRTFASLPEFCDTVTYTPEALCFHLLRNGLAVREGDSQVTVLSCTNVKGSVTLRLSKYEIQVVDGIIRLKELSAEQSLHDVHLNEVKPSIENSWLASGESGLYRIDQDLNLTQLNKNAVLLHDVNPAFLDEVLFVDYKNRLYWGSCTDAEGKWNKLECWDKTMDAAWTDHPRRIVSATAKAVSVHDLVRCDLNEVWRSPESEHVVKISSHGSKIWISTNRNLLAFSDNFTQLLSVNHSSVLGPSLIVHSNSASGHQPLLLYNLFLNELLCVPVYLQGTRLVTTDAVFRMKDQNESFNVVQDRVKLTKDTLKHLNDATLTGVRCLSVQNSVVVLRLSHFGDLYFEVLGAGDASEGNELQIWESFDEKTDKIGDTSGLPKKNLLPMMTRKKSKDKEATHEHIDLTEINKLDNCEPLELGFSHDLMESGASPSVCGFRGSFNTANNDHSGVACGYDGGHLAMTYSALCCLIILDDDLTRIDRHAVLAGVAACQLPSGSFCAHPGGSESDMRFVYCASVICAMLADSEMPFDIEKTCDFIRKSQNYDGGIGQGPGLESHGGSTFCAIASLSLLDRLWDHSVLEARRLRALKLWCVKRQEEGFHGRAHKADDSCYTFWLGATHTILNCIDLVDTEKLRHFTLSTQDERCGGFGKYADEFPDALHTYFALSGLSLLNEPGLNRVCPELNITLGAATKLSQLHKTKRP